MKSKLILGLLSLFMVFSMTSCMEKVDAGCEGIKVNLYGSDKGVDDASLITGIVWYNPWTTTVYEYPTKGLDEVIRGTLYNYVKDAFRIQLNKFTTDDIVSKRDSMLRQQALTPAILEKMWIEKWDGKLPVYGQVPTIFKDISK